MSVFLFILFVLAFVLLYNCVKIVPQRKVYIIERLGKFNSALSAGFYFLAPFIDKVAYIHTLKEQVVDVPAQSCITKDNIQVEVDGVLYIQVIDPERASYGVDNYYIATINMAQTTMRSILGQMSLDSAFEERATINNSIVKALDEASAPWGIKVNRYEVKNIIPPKSIKDAMEKHMKAEREKRALIAESEGIKQAEINKAEGERQAMINLAEGERQAAINRSEGEMQKRINEAKGQAQEIELVAAATSIGIKTIADAINLPGGSDAVSLRVAESYITEFGKLAKESNTMIIPSNVADLASMISVGTQAFKKS